MANVRLGWDSVAFKASDVSGWVSFKKAVSIDDHEELLSDRAVYVIRVSQPFSFQYEKGHSPVIYIGKGQAQARITAHLKSWIPLLSATIPELKVRICFSTPTIRKRGTICEHVEADLIAKFVAKYGELPLRNRNTPPQLGRHVYDPADLSVLHPGRGTRYHWAIQPLKSSQFYRAG